MEQSEPLGTLCRIGLATSPWLTKRCRQDRAIFQDRRDKTLFIDGAPVLRYGEIVTVVNAAKGAGVDRVGIITPEVKAGR